MKKTLSDISIELNEQSGHVNSPCLIFITDNEAQPCPEEVIDKLPKKSMVILRDYDYENRYELGKALRYICRTKEIKFLVAGDLTLALMLEADGIHIPEPMMNEVPQIKKDHPEFIISISCHNEASLKQAVKFEDDLIILAPVFPTKSHPETYDDPSLTLGPDKVQELCTRYIAPIYALGGVNVETALHLQNTGVAGIAAIRGFLNKKN